MHAALVQALAARVAAGESWAARVDVDSCGLGGWHAGEAPDVRVQREGQRRGIRVDHPARMLNDADWNADLVLAVEVKHLGVLRERAPLGFDKRRIVLFRGFDPAAGPEADLADPYYEDDAAFGTMFDHTASALPGLLDALKRLVEAQPA